MASWTYKCADRCGDLIKLALMVFRVHQCSKNTNKAKTDWKINAMWRQSDNNENNNNNEYNFCLLFMSKEGLTAGDCACVLLRACIFPPPFVGINKLVTRNQRWSRSDLSLWCSCSRTFCSVRWKPYVIHYLFLLKLPFFTVFNLRLYYKYQAHNQCTLYWPGLALGHKMSAIILFTPSFISK